MRTLVQTALRFRLLVLAVAAGLLVLGATAVTGERVEPWPEFTPPYTEIQTEALGLSAEEVEQLITVPLEADLLNGVEGVATIRSESWPGLSSIVLVFAPGTDIYRARQLVEERLTQAHALPNVSKPPTLLQPTSSSRRLLLIGLRSDNLTHIEQSLLARWTVRPRLMGVPGVANIAIWGMRDQQLQVQVDPQVLAAKGVTLAQIVRSAGNAQVVSPLSFLEASTPGTGGFIETPQQRLQVRHLLEQIADPQALAMVPVDGTNGRLRLGDVSTIVIDHQPLIGDATVGGGPGLLLAVEKLPDADSVEVTRGVEAALETLRPGLTGMQTDTSVFRPGDDIGEATGNLARVLLIGGALLLISLLLSGFGLRAALIPLVTIPLSLLTAMVIMDLLGHSLNAITTAGLTAALLFVVQDGVATASQAARLLPRIGSDDYLLTRLVPRLWTGWRRPAMYSGLALLVCLTPVTVIGGRPGAFFAPLAAAYGIAILMSLGTGLTLSAALAMLLLPGGRPARQPRRIIWRAARSYLEVVNAGLRRPRIVAGTVIVAGGLAVGLAALLGTSFVPSLQDRNVVVRLDAPPGTSRAQMVETTGRLGDQLAAIDGIAGIAAHVGRAVTGDRVADVSTADIWLRLSPEADVPATLAAIRDRVEQEPALTHRVAPYSEEAIRAVGALTDGRNAAGASDVDLLTGATQPLVVRVYGQDRATLAGVAERVRSAVASVDGVEQPRITDTATQPSVQIEVDLARAQQAGMNPGDVRRAEATLLQGIQVGSVFEGQKVFDVIVQGVPETRRGIADIENLLIDKPAGGQVRLGDVADVRLVEAASVIRRNAVSRYVDVVAGVEGRASGDVAADVTARLRGLDLPLEYHAEVVPGSTDDEAQRGRVLGAALLALIAVLLLMQAVLRRWRVALLVMLALPAALLGGVVAIWLTGGVLTLGGALGLMATLGLYLRGSVEVLHQMQLRERTARLDRVAVLRSALLRSVPPLLVAGVATLAVLLPLVVAGPQSGLEVLHPLGVTTIGGLLTALAVVAVAVPLLYVKVADRAPHDWPDGEEDDGPIEPEAVMSPWLVAHPRSGGLTDAPAGSSSPEPVR